MQQEHCSSNAFCGMFDSRSGHKQISWTYVLCLMQASLKDAEVYLRKQMISGGKGQLQVRSTGHILCPETHRKLAKKIALAWCRENKAAIGRYAGALSDEFSSAHSRGILVEGAVVALSSPVVQESLVVDWPVGNCSLQHLALSKDLHPMEQLKGSAMSCALYKSAQPVSLAGRTQALQFTIGYRLQLGQSRDQGQHHCAYRGLSADARTSIVLNRWAMFT